MDGDDGQAPDDVAARVDGRGGAVTRSEWFVPTLRLLLLDEAAAYLRVSSWTVRDYVVAGLLPTVSLRALRAREGARPRQTLRRLLFDVRDLDAFIDRAKDARAQVLKTCVPESRVRKQG